MIRKALVALALVCVSLQAQVKKPKLVLTIVVDQFRYDYLTRFRADYKDGLAQLLTKGAVFANANYEHFPTVTAVGHSTILSGATPAVSGIIGNEWTDRATKQDNESIWDDEFPVLGAESKHGASPRKMLVSTIGDQLKMVDARSRVFGVSIKDRSAILPAGHMANGAYWFDAVSGNFVSSKYYFADLPEWVTKYNSDRPADKWLGKSWMPFDGAAGAKPFMVLGKEAKKTYYDNLELTPFGNELVEAFAEAVVQKEHLGEDAITDVLSVSFSSNDRIGHKVGPDAPEIRDISVQTDRVVGKLLRFLDQKIGLANVTVVFTADHGAAPAPEVQSGRKMPGGRVSSGDLKTGVQKALAAKYGEGEWVVGRPKFMLYLDRDLINKKSLKLEEVQATAASALRTIPHVARAYTSTDLQAGRVQGDFFDAAVRNGFNSARGGDLYIVLEPYYLFGRGGTTESGTDHGMPYSYDTHVPVILMGAGIRPGEYAGNVFVNDIAPTLATLLGIETPSGSVGRVLTEAVGK